MAQYAEFDLCSFVASKAVHGLFVSDYLANVWFAVDGD